ncbi:MAG: tRNA (adenosine(37)-N6)-threonylcarbamoyltransferase complex ATPase subunit type 1 TsaE [Actinomycetota bacterium]|nr:tRNA (adenosine(37)-N6)-threonylcarbamoyltransferase complex ATPase subunit type 1 TsaE [Actinomycetota bacterium]
MAWEDMAEEALEDLAAKIALTLKPGDVVVLSGEVGAGKTTFVRAAALSLGVAERVTSPTYQLARSYEGTVDGRRVAVNHLDLYRIEGIEAGDVLELDDYLEPRAVTFVEWAEPALALLEDPTVVRISHQTPATRRVNIEGPVAERLEC